MLSCVLTVLMPRLLLIAASSFGALVDPLFCPTNFEISILTSAQTGRDSCCTSASLSSQSLRSCFSSLAFLTIIFLLQLLLRQFKFVFDFRHDGSPPLHLQRLLYLRCSGTDANSFWTHPLVFALIRVTLLC